MAKALVDGDFRQRLIDEPVETLRDDPGVSLPDGFTLHVHQDDGVGSAHIVFLPRSELTVEELEQVAAGSKCDGTQSCLLRLLTRLLSPGASRSRAPPDPWFTRCRDPDDRTLR